MLAALNGWEILAIFVVVLLIFGAKKLPELAKGLGQGIKEFRKASRDMQDELNQAMDSEPSHAPPQKRVPDQTAPRATDVASAPAEPQESSPQSKA
jgi:sec-independent protein translocase protein TatA